MKKQGGGSIVCISSGNSQRYTTRRSPYNITKAGINGLVGTLAVEWGRFNIRINGVARALWIRSCSGSASKTASSMWTTICWWFP